EDLLRAVAVVIVDVEDGYPSRPRIPQELRGNGGVVQIAVAAVEIGPGVMPRGTAEGEGRRRAGRDLTRTRQRDVGRRPGRRPGAGRDGRTDVEGIKAQPAVQRIRNMIAGQAAERPGHGQ